MTKHLPNPRRQNLFLALLTHVKYSTVYIWFCAFGNSGQSGFIDLNPRRPLSVYVATLGLATSFRPLIIAPLYL